MPSPHWIAKRRVLLATRQAAIRRNPQGFAAYQVVKHLARTRSPGETGYKTIRPVKTAGVFFDRANAKFGRAVLSEFQRRGVKTKAQQLVTPARPVKLDSGEKRRVMQASNRHAVVFAANDPRSIHEARVNAVVEQAEKGYKRKKGTRLAMMYGLNPKATRETLTGRTKQTLAFTRKTFEAVHGSRRITVRTANGTNISFGLSPKMRWAQDNGIISRNYWGNLPAGEVFTSPATANGILVLDGVMTNVGMLGKTPITVRIRNGRAVKESVQCRDPRIKARFLGEISSERFADRIGELGLGTNLAVKKLGTSDLVDEKYPGVHVAFGDPEGADTGAKWETESAHNDAILRKPTIIVDGRTIMRNGKSLLK